MFTKFAGFVTVIAMALSGVALVATPAGALVNSGGEAGAVAKVAKKKANKKSVAVKKNKKKAARKAAQKAAQKAARKAANKPQVKPSVSTPAAVVSGRMGPGSVVVVGEHACTVGFLFEDGTNRYVSISADCAGRALGESVRITDAGSQVGTGTLRHLGADDFALVEIKLAAGVTADGSVPGWGGPAGLGVAPLAGASVFFATANGVRVGTIQDNDGKLGVSALVQAANRGAGLVDEQGLAVGVITGESDFLSLEAAMDGARAAGFTGLELVSGGVFRTAAVG
jgi:hypothetical protein